MKVIAALNNQATAYVFRSVTRQSSCFLQQANREVHELRQRTDDQVTSPACNKRTPGRILFIKPRLCCQPSIYSQNPIPSGARPLADCLHHTQSETAGRRQPGLKQPEES